MMAGEGKYVVAFLATIAMWFSMLCVVLVILERDDKPAPPAKHAAQVAGKPSTSEGS